MLRRGGERWSTENICIEDKLREQETKFLEAVDALGMLSSTKPSKQSCVEQNHIAILCGALEKRLYSRISIINEAICEGFCPRKVVAATGYRKLLVSECPQIIKEEDRTEANMITCAWRVESQKLSNLSQLPFELSIAELGPHRERCNTEDTARKLATHPDINGENVLIYVEQPFASRFHAIFESLLTQNRNKVFLYAKGLSPENARNDLFIFQDEVARRIYFQYPTIEKKYNI